MKVNSISSRSRRRPARLAAARRFVRVVRDSHGTRRESQITVRRPRCTSFGSLLTSHCSLIMHPLIGSARIRNGCNSSAINAQRTFNRYKFACLRARCSRFFHSANRQPQLATPPFLIGTPSRLEIELTRSQQTRKHFLIGTIRPTFTSVPPLTRHLSLITHDWVTSLLFDTNGIHKIVVLLKTKEKRLSIRYRFALRAAGAANYPLPITSHPSLITPHKSRVTNHDSRYNCASKCAAGQSNTQPLAQPATGNRRGTKPASACGHLILRH
jgi:hypothetical protein